MARRLSMRAAASMRRRASVLERLGLVLERVAASCSTQRAQRLQEVGEGACEGLGGVGQAGAGPGAGRRRGRP